MLIKANFFLIFYGLGLLACFRLKLNSESMNPFNIWTVWTTGHSTHCAASRYANVWRCESSWQLQFCVFASFLFIKENVYLSNVKNIFLFESYNSRKQCILTE